MAHRDYPHDEMNISVMSKKSTDKRIFLPVELEDLKDEENGTVQNQLTESIAGEIWRRPGRVYIF